MKRGRLRIRSRRGGEGEASSPVMRKSQRACAAGEWGRPPSSILFAGCSGSPSSNPFFNLIHQRGICPLPLPSPPPRYRVSIKDVGISVHCVARNDAFEKGEGVAVSRLTYYGEKEGWMYVFFLCGG